MKVTRENIIQLLAYVHENCPGAMDDTTEIPDTATELHALYSTLAAHVKEHFQRTGKRCELGLQPQLRDLEGKRVEAVDVYGDTRRFWVGRSTGWIPCHLEIARSNSHGGDAIEQPYASVRVLREHR